MDKIFCGGQGLEVRGVNEAGALVMPSAALQTGAGSGVAIDMRLAGDAVEPH